VIVKHAFRACCVIAVAASATAQTPARAAATRSDDCPRDPVSFHPCALAKARTFTPPRTPDDLELKILMPAYILSELKAGFQIGAVLFLPFLIIDLVIASVTLSIGMVQLPPVMISAPFKILLFVLVDGWNLVVGSLMKSFY